MLWDQLSVIIIFIILGSPNFNCDGVIISLIFLSSMNESSLVERAES